MKQKIGSYLIIEFVIVAVICLMWVIWHRSTTDVYNIIDYGAKSGGGVLCTDSIQKAINACSAKGGGTIYLPAGKFLSGTIYLKSNITLKLDAGCTLLGSRDTNDYPQNIPKIRSYTDNYVCQSLIAGEDLNNIAIVGRGEIDGNGSAFCWRQYENRPYVIRLINCNNVLIENIRLKNSPMWMQHYLTCSNLTIRGITVDNHTSYNNDGIDIDGCSNVTISDCKVDSDDDAICLKSTLDRACENIIIIDCSASSHCNAIKIGTETVGGFKNITIKDCTVSSSDKEPIVPNRNRGLAGIALEIVDGGTLDGVSISNIVMDGIKVPIFMRLGDRGRPYKKDVPKADVGIFRNVKISSITAQNASSIGCSITALPGHMIENVSLSDINIVFDGNVPGAVAAKEVPEKPQASPESTMFGILPAYGFYCRHVKGLSFSNISLKTRQPDLRHALICDDVEDLVIDNLDAQFSPDAEPVIYLKQVKDAVIQGCKPTADVFLKLQGDKSRNVTLSGNDFSLVKKVVLTLSDVPANIVTGLEKQ